MNEIPLDWEVESPSLTLFAFHLRNDTKGVRDNANQLWEQCITLGEQHDIPLLKSLKTALRSYTYNSKDSQYQYTPNNEDREATEAEKPYLDDLLELVRKDPKLGQARQLSFHALTGKDDLQLMGELYPLRIHDTYAIDLTLRYRQTVDFTQFSLLNSFEEIRGSLGQTLLFFAKPVNVPESNYQDFANQCVAALLPQTANNLNPSCQGQLFGSPIFEYKNDQENPRERPHILVWLNSHPETQQYIGQSEAYHALLNLLCCRHKILFAHHQSSLCSEAAWEIYSQLEEKVEELTQPPEETLEQLKQWLKQIPQTAFHYTKYLRDIEYHRTAIATNIQNYASRLEKLQTFSLPNDDLTFLQYFLNSTCCKQSQKQIQVDLNYLTPSQNLFQQMTETIRGLVEVDQAERDRILEEAFRESEKAAQEREQKLQLWIALVGTGLAVSGISSQVESTPVETILNYRQPNQPPICPTAGASTCILYSFLDVMIHVFVGVAAALLLRLIVKLKR